MVLLGHTVLELLDFVPVVGERTVKVGKAVSTTCRMIGAIAQTGVNAINFDKAFRSVQKEYRETGRVSFLNGANAVLSGLGVVGGIAQSVSSVKNFNKMRSSLSSKGGSETVQTINNKFPSDNQMGKRFNYTTENGRVHIENGVQNVDFVIDMDGNLQIGRGHSYLSGGGSVQAAGTMKVNSQGYIRLITNESGHFQPTITQALNYPTIFKNAGLNVENAWIRIGEFQTSMSNYVIDSKVFYNGPIKNMP